MAERAIKNFFLGRKTSHLILKGWKNLAPQILHDYAFPFGPRNPYQFSGDWPMIDFYIASCAWRQEWPLGWLCASPLGAIVKT